MQHMLKRLQEARKDEGGFTLIELLVVIVIIGILAGVVVFAVQGISDRGEDSACSATAKTVEVAVEAFYAETGAYPNELEDLNPGFLRLDNVGGTVAATTITMDAGGEVISYDQESGAVTDSCT